MWFLHNVKCKRCKSPDIIRSGVKNLVQKFKCKTCCYCFAKNDGRTSVEKHKKRVAAFFTYDELKLSIYEISQLFGIQIKTVAKWLGIEKQSFSDKEYREKMKSFRMINEYYMMARKLLNMHDDYYEKERKKNIERKIKERKMKEMKEIKKREIGEEENQIFDIFQEITKYGKNEIDILKSNLNSINIKNTTNTIFDRISNIEVKIIENSLFEKEFKSLSNSISNNNRIKRDYG